MLDLFFARESPKPGATVDAFVNRRGASPRPATLLRSEAGASILVDGFAGDDRDAPGRSESVERELGRFVDAVFERRPVMLGSQVFGTFRGIAIDDPGHRVCLFADPSGLLPWFYAARAEGFYAGSSVHQVGARIRAPINPVAALQLMTLLYSVGTHTLFSGVEQLQTCQVILHDLRAGASQSFDLPSCFQGEPFEDDVERLTGLVWERLVRACERVGRFGSPVGCMLSGGLDSRMVVAAFREAGVPIVTATHGERDYHEVHLAARVARIAGAFHHLVDLAATPYLGDRPTFESSMDAATMATFPVWHQTAQRLKQASAVTVTSGYCLDASLGGHFHDPITRGRRLRRRLSSAIGWHGRAGAELASDAYVERFADMLGNKLRSRLADRSPLLLAERRDELLASVEPAIAVIHAELDRYRRSTTHPVKVVERFLHEQHARKHSFSQELIAGCTLPNVVPTYDRDFIGLLARIDQRLMIDHVLYTRVIRAYGGPFAKVGGSSTALPVTAPQPLLEVVRAARNRYDHYALRLFMRTKGALDLTWFGACNYERVLRRAENLQALRNVLDGGVVPRLLDLRVVLGEIRAIEAYEQRAFNFAVWTTLASLGIAYARSSSWA